MDTPFVSLMGLYMPSPRRQLELEHHLHTMSTLHKLRWPNASYSSRTYSSKWDFLKYVTNPPLQLVTTTLQPPNYKSRD